MDLRSQTGKRGSSHMLYRELGRTGLNVSVLSQGGAAFGQQYGPVSLGEAGDCVRAAIDAGINLIDTSAYYGKGRSEEMLGEVLQGGWRERTYLCSKAGRLDVDQFDFSAAGMVRCFEGSLRRLRTEAIDILIAHDIEFATDFEAIFGETADVLHKLKRQGKCRFIGMSGYPLSLLCRAIERCNLDVVISYSHFTLQNQHLVTELLPVAEQHGVGVLNGSPLCLGLLTNQGPPPWHPGSERLKAAARQAAELCRQRGADISRLGMQFCFGEERIVSTITGAPRKEELAVNLNALSTPIDRGLLSEVQSILAAVMNETWPSGNWKE
jgi:aryl-alcohol dehydrogenase-like predicted oxidoreductase